MIIEESPRPCTDIEELKAERSYYRAILDNLAYQANLNGADAFEKLKNCIISRKKIYYRIEARKKKSGWLFFQDEIFEHDLLASEDLDSMIVALEENGFTKIKIRRERCITD